MAATTDQEARFLDLTTSILEMVRDGNRDIEEVLDVFQLIKDQPNFAKFLSMYPPEPARPAAVVLAYPAMGEIFELTLDGDVPEHQSLEMVRRDGYGGKWRHDGPVVQGKQTRRFKLVQIGYCRTFDEVLEKLAKYGKIPEGQWREAFRVAYPKPDGDGPIGIADFSWVNPHGYAHFPYVRADGHSYFHWADDDFYESWRWLVEVSE